MILTRRFDNEKLEVKEVTLLSIAEYEAAKEYIPMIKGWWWLRSPGMHSLSAASVRSDGWVLAYGDFVNNTCNVVRPALRAANLIPLGLRKGDQVIGIAGHSWTVISDDLLICNDSVGEHCFREDWEAEDANVYAASDVKKYLEEWAQENRITIQ